MRFFLFKNDWQKINTKQKLLFIVIGRLNFYVADGAAADVGTIFCDECDALSVTEINMDSVWNLLGT